MRRTQLYIEDEIWQALHLEARREKTSISDLVRRAVRDRYSREKRSAAMRAVVGLWKDRTDLPGTEQYVRHLRSDDRLEHLERLKRQ